MAVLNRHARVDLALEIIWGKNCIKHIENYFINGLNCWRDVQDGHILEKILDLAEGEKVSVNLPPGEIVPDFREDKLLKLEKGRHPLRMSGQHILPGRFYPQGMLTGIPGIFKGNMNPFRIVEKGGGFVVADLNHPMAGVPLQVNMHLLGLTRISAERGGGCMDWLEQALSGPGMQSRVGSRPTPFLYDGALKRKDETSDNVFYQADRLVGHIDRNAHRNVRDIYGQYIKTGDRILDLMAGWESHLPEDVNELQVHGLGMNQNELRQNPQLTDFSIQDLNEVQTLTFPDNAFDAVLCSLSVEYLTDPLPVFREISRVLKPGGRLVVTFSNRWFPEKAIRIWRELHEFERMGLVLEYFLSCGKFESLETISVRGYPRPSDDKYAGELKTSDPVFAVSGKNI